MSFLFRLGAMRVCCKVDLRLLFSFPKVFSESAKSSIETYFANSIYNFKSVL